MSVVTLRYALLSGQLGCRSEDLGHGERAGRGRQRLDQHPAQGCVALVKTGQAQGDGVVGRWCESHEPPHYGEGRQRLPTLVAAEGNHGGQHGAVEGVHAAAEGPSSPSLRRSGRISGQPRISPFRALWPEYNLHGNDSGTYFGALFPRFAHLQLLFVDHHTERVVARARSIPFRWDGTLGDLPGGIDAVGGRALDDLRPPTALCALSAEVAADYQGRGLSRRVLRAMTDAAVGPASLPSSRPSAPVGRIAIRSSPSTTTRSWTRSDSLPFDPWLRVHARLGATALRCEQRSMRIDAPTHEWEQWTDMSFPADGDFVFPAGLAPLRVAGGTGYYWEPNVWMLHQC